MTVICEKPAKNIFRTSITVKARQKAKFVSPVAFSFRLILNMLMTACSLTPFRALAIEFWQAYKRPKIKMNPVMADIRIAYIMPRGAALDAC